MQQSFCIKTRQKSRLLGSVRILTVEKIKRIVTYRRKIPKKKASNNEKLIGYTSS